MAALKKFDFTRTLGWSARRYEIFQTCRRKYYYFYYAEMDPEYPVIRIERLKSLTTVPLEVGNIVHDIIKILLERLQKTDKPIDTRRFFEYARRKTEEYCGAKKFMEIHYQELKEVDIDAIYDKVIQSAENLLGSERFTWITTEAILNRQNWLVEPPGYGETRIDNLKAYCKVDFLFPVDNRIFILDWKTGKVNEAKHRKQLVGYAAFAMHHFDHDPAEIFPIVAYLNPVYKEIPLTINEFDIQEFTGTIREQTGELQAMCINVEDNLPKPKDEFTKTLNQAFCSNCNFRELCFDTKS